jgi:5-methylcytosine-specific restriction endonuclease McrA
MKKQMNMLKKLGAPQALLDSFEDVCEINSQLPDETKSSFPTLLEEQCRRFGFHDILPEGWFFRPYTCDGASRRADIAVKGIEPEAPAIEQAYRRGVLQGFAMCRQLLQDKKELKDIEKHEGKIHIWRGRTVQRFGSQPGDDERPPRKLFGGRNSISDKLRWLVLDRDCSRCVKCGLGPSSTVTLEVDHIVPVANGGFDTIDNLQTLCIRCNRGKSDS